MIFHKHGLYLRFGNLFQPFSIQRVLLKNFLQRNKPCGHYGTSKIYGSKVQEQ